MHISLFWTGGPYVEAVRKAGEESPTRLICLTNTAGAATRPLPPVRLLSYLPSMAGRERLPQSPRKPCVWQRRREHVIVGNRANIDVVHDQLCGYIISALFIFPGLLVWPSIWDGPQYPVSKAIVWVVCFRFGSRPPPRLLPFLKPWSCHQSTRLWWNWLFKNP